MVQISYSSRKPTDGFAHLGYAKLNYFYVCFSGCFLFDKKGFLFLNSKYFSSRYFHWNFGLYSLLFMVIALIPFYIAYFCISNIRFGKFLLTVLISFLLHHHCGSRDSFVWDCRPYVSVDYPINPSVFTYAQLACGIYISLSTTGLGGAPLLILNYISFVL